MKRDFYTVKSYDGLIEKHYKNFKCAYNFCNKLISKDIDCGIYIMTLDNDTCIIGC